MLRKLLSPWGYLPVFLLALLVTLTWGQVFVSHPSNAATPQNYQVERDVVYRTVNNQDLKLDLYKNKQPGLHPTLLVIHGGGWIKQSKEGLEPFFNPYLDWGFSVVNINYRLASAAIAPAAVEDSLCALRWVYDNADKYNFDTNKIVTTGFSAGGHLALTTGTMTPELGLDRRCPGDEELKAAAVVNWSGITDVGDLLYGPNEKYYAVEWFGNRVYSNELEIAKKVSPLNYVRPGLPPILTIHGDKDAFVPYDHGVRLHKALDEAGVVNQLYPVKGGKHGGYTKEQKQEIYGVIKDFLKNQGLIE